MEIHVCITILAFFLYPPRRSLVYLEENDVLREGELSHAALGSQLFHFQVGLIVTQALPPSFLVC